MKKIIFSLLAYILVGVSCKKNDTPDPVPTPVVKFISLSSGSTWHYELINNVVPSTTAFTLTSTSRDSVIGSKTYHVFTNSSAANEYYNIAGNDYYNFRNLPSAIGGSSVEYNYLKDNIAVGANWSQSFPVTVGGFALNATLNNTITEKGITKIVKGVTYINVFHVTTTVTITISGIALPAGALVTDIQTYYAEKYGMIQANNKINLNYAGIVDNTDQQTNLISADIK
jgi:hypothetical protein